MKQTHVSLYLRDSVSDLINSSNKLNSNLSIETGEGTAEAISYNKHNILIIIKFKATPSVFCYDFYLIQKWLEMINYANLIYYKWLLANFYVSGIKISSYFYLM